MKTYRRVIFAFFVVCSLVTTVLIAFNRLTFLGQTMQKGLPLVIYGTAAFSHIFGLALIKNRDKNILIRLARCVWFVCIITSPVIIAISYLPPSGFLSVTGFLTGIIVGGFFAFGSIATISMLADELLK